MDPIPTRVGWADFGDYDTYGKRLYRDLAGKTPFLALAAFSLTGKLLDDEDAKVLDDLAVCVHVPEPRVWPVKLARVAATSGTVVTGLVAGASVLDSAYIGVHAAGAAASVLRELAGFVERTAATNGARSELIAQFVASREHLAGFGVQARRVDERVVAMRAALTARGRAGRPFWSLGEELWAAAEKKGLGVNVFGAVAAALSDLDLDPDAVASMLALLLQPSFLAHAHEGTQRRAASLARLPADAIRYVGKAPRTSARAARAARETLP
jgi:hypothetical protein